MSTSCPAFLIPHAALEAGTIEKEEDMGLFRGNPSGKVYITGTMGKRWIGPTEYNAWKAIGFTLKNVPDSDINKIPNWDDKVAATIFKPAGHSGAALKTWIGSYDTHRKTATGRQNHVSVENHIKNTTKHDGGGEYTDAQAVKAVKDKL